MEEKRKAYAVMFVSRNKDNRKVKGFKERRMAFLSDRDPETLILRFKRFTRDGVDGEVCRFYRSVNPRDLEKARKKLIVALVEADSPDTLLRIEARTVSIAMTAECAAKRKWLFDFDNENEDDLREFMGDVIHDGGFDQLSFYATPHGFGVIAPHGFDTRSLMAKWGECCDLKRDAMAYFAMGMLNGELVTTATTETHTYQEAGQEDTSVVAGRIAGVMKANGVSLERLAVRLNVPVSEAQHLISGDSAPDDEDLANIACAIGMTSAYLRGESDAIRPKCRLIAKGTENMPEEEKERIVRILLGDEKE